MRCPNDSSELFLTKHQGIDVRTCPACQGVWLDRHQLDQIIDQAIASQYADSPDGLDDLEALDDGKGRNRRRDKYTEGFDDFDRSRKGKRRKSRRDSYDEMFEY